MMLHQTLTVSETDAGAAAARVVTGPSWRRSGAQLVVGLYRHRRVVWSMAVREMRNRYAGTMAGTAWAVVAPVSTLLVYWFVFSVALRVSPTGGVPFIVAFACGYVPWLFFSETLASSATVLQRNATLVKKTIFPAETLPLSQLVAALTGHLVLTAALIVVLWVAGMALSPRMLLLVHYLAGMVLFAAGLALLVASVNALVPDVALAMQTVMNVWFWCTPIVWDPSTVPDAVRVILQLNPMYHVVTGYRAAILSTASAGVVPTVWFWIACVAMFVVGALAFSRLKPEFAEVL